MTQEEREVRTGLIVGLLFWAGVGYVAVAGGWTLRTAGALLCVVLILRCFLPDRRTSVRNRFPPPAPPRKDWRA